MLLLWGYITAAALYCPDIGFGQLRYHHAYRLVTTLAISTTKFLALMKCIALGPLRLGIAISWLITH